MLLFLTAIVLQSCLDDWDDKYDTLFAVGTVKVIEGKDYYFSLDEGSKLYPSDTTYVHDYAVTDGQRAFIYFRELEEKLPGYEYNAQIKPVAAVCCCGGSDAVDAWAGSLRRQKRRQG